MRATLEHEGSEDGHDPFAGGPELLGDEPQVLDLYWRLRRATPGDQAVSIDAALRLHEVAIGEPGSLGYLDEIEAMDAAFREHRAGEFERRSAAEKRKAEKPAKRKGA